MKKYIGNRVEEKYVFLTDNTLRLYCDFVCIFATA